MEGVGSRLKNLRLQKGLTLQEVNKKTRIHLNILKAIEEDSLLALNPVYIKGFFKIYCKFLGVDPKDYLPDYKEPHAPLKLSPESAAIIQPSGSFLKSSLGKLRSFRGIPIRIKPILIIIAIIASAIFLFNLGKFISSRRRREHVRLPVILAPRLARASLAKVEHAGAAKPKKEALSVLRLGLRAKEDCWVDLKVDGRTVFRTILKKGQFESWSAKERLDFSLGNAGVVGVELDGRAIPALGRKGQSIKGIRITKNEGLVVPR